MQFSNKDLFKSESSSEKYQSPNPISRFLVNRFLHEVILLVQKTGALQIHEVGCGEGQIIGLLARSGYNAKGSDISLNSIKVARQEAQKQELSIDLRVSNIFDLDDNEDSAEMIVCCEVLEHIEDADEALCKLSKLAKPYAVISVPREPVWRVLNMLRGKYLGELGNTPGHINHWSSSGFISFIGRYFEIIEVRRPLPWTIILCRSKLFNNGL